MMKIRPLALGAALLVTASGVTAPPEPGAPVPLSARAVLARMAARNPSLLTYTARVHVDIHMLSFPYLSPRLDGTSYYRRPDTYVVVFDRMPSYARGFGRLFNDVGNPQAWERDQNVSLEGTTLLNGRETLVLRLTKKIHSDILDHTLAYVDAASFALMQMEWYYTSGGKIVMTQGYRLENDYWLLSQQHATIAIPYVRAVADASYGSYRTNATVDTKANR